MYHTLDLVEFGCYSVVSAGDPAGGVANITGSDEVLRPLGKNGGPRSGVVAGQMSYCDSLELDVEYNIEFQGGTSSGRRKLNMHSGTGDPKCASLSVGAHGMLEIVAAEVAK